MGKSGKLNLSANIEEKFQQFLFNLCGPNLKRVHKNRPTRSYEHFLSKLL